MTLVEIKSQRDTLERCDAQMAAFEEHGHTALLVAHTCWFDHEPYHNGSPRLAWGHSFPRRSSIWHFPEPEASTPGYFYRWSVNRPGLPQPAPRKFLGLLWRDELIAECARHRVDCGKRPNMPSMIDQMAYLMTGREITHAVCRQLRARPFPMADLPIAPVMVEAAE